MASFQTQLGWTNRENKNSNSISISTRRSSDLHHFTHEFELKSQVEDTILGFTVSRK